MRKRTQAREIVLIILYQKDIFDEDWRDLLNTYFETQVDVDPDIKKFAARILQGTLENVAVIDPIISKYADNWHLDRMAVIDRNILRFAVYELLFMADIPPKVTINESINIAKKYSQDESGKFVNGVLDKINHSEKFLVPKTV